MWNTNQSEIARVMDEVEVATRAEWYGILGMVRGVNQRDFLTGCREHLAYCFEDLAALVGKEEAINLMNEVNTRVMRSFQR